MASGLVIAAMLSGAAAAQGVSAFDGQYVGELTLTGIISGDCSKPPLGAVYPLTIARGIVRFAYVPRFATTLTGTVDAKGAFRAAARVHSGTVTMTGKVSGGTVTAAITSPSCAYAFEGRP